MKARVKAQDHINLDGLGLGTASVIARALRLLVEYEAGNEVTTGLGMTAALEIEAAIEEAEAMKNGVAKELRKQRRNEMKAEVKAIKSEVPESLTGEILVSEEECDVDQLEATAESDWQESHIENQAGYTRSEQHKADLAVDHCG